MALQVDALFIIGISLFTAFLGEGVTYLLVYRTETYKKLKMEIDKQIKKCNVEILFSLIKLTTLISSGEKEGSAGRGD
jgi:hypothetical protein